MFKLNNYDMYPVMPKTAAKYLEKNTYRGQRNFKSSRVKELEKICLNGEFLTGNIAFAKYNRDEVLVNGQHQLNMIINCNVTIIAAVTFYDCDSEKDISNLYRQFDNHKNRTFGDCLKAENTAIKTGWPQNIANLFLSGLVIANEMDVGKNEKIGLLGENKNAGAFIHNIFVTSLPKGIRSGSIKFLKTPAVVASMIKTSEKDNIDANVFWQDVRDGINLSGNSPPLALRNYLSSLPARKDKITNRKILYKSMSAWNAWRKGKVTALKYYENSPIPTAS